MQPSPAREQFNALSLQITREACACGRELFIAWLSDAYHLRCGACGYDPETRIIPSQSIRQRFRRGEPLSVMEKMILHRQLYKEVNLAKNEGTEPKPRTLRLMEQLEAKMNPDTKALTIPQMGIQREQAIRFVDMAKLTSPTVTREMAIDYLERTGLNPLADEVCIYEGKLYPMVHGLRHLALRSPAFDGCDAPQFLSASEQESEGYLVDEIVCRITMYRKGISRGFVEPARPTVPSPIATTRWRFSSLLAWRRTVPTAMLGVKHFRTC